MTCHGLDEQNPYAGPLGYAGVLLFFAISGFLITSRMLDEHELTGTLNLGKFYLRRAFRILPPALFFLLVSTVLGLLGVIPFNILNIAKALFFVRNYTYLDYADHSTWFSAHFWSLSVEEHFYLIWPTVLVLAGMKRARWVAPALATATIVWRGLDEHFEFVARTFHAPYLSDNWGRTDYLADVLLWGCTLAIWLGRRPWKLVLPKGTSTVVCWGLLGFIYVAFFTPYFPHSRNFVNLFMAMLVGCTVTDPGGLLGRILEWSPLRFIGRLSYSLYLWQQLFFHGAQAPRWFQQFPLNLVFIFAAACFSYYLVERPTVRLGHRFARPPKLGHPDDVRSPESGTAEMSVASPVGSEAGV